MPRASYICYGISTYRKEIAFQKISLTDLIIEIWKKIKWFETRKFFSYIHQGNGWVLRKYLHFLYYSREH